MPGLQYHFARVSSATMLLLLSSVISWGCGAIGALLLGLQAWLQAVNIEAVILLLACLTFTSMLTLPTMPDPGYAK